jgi:hypothetical protein
MPGAAGLDEELRDSASSPNKPVTIASGRRQSYGSAQKKLFSMPTLPKENNSGAVPPLPPQYVPPQGTEEVEEGSNQKSELIPYEEQGGLPGGGHYTKTANFRRLKQSFDGPVESYLTSDGRGHSRRKLFIFRRPQTEPSEVT